jgi:hypothetical protein
MIMRLAAILGLTTSSSLGIIVPRVSYMEPVRNVPTFKKGGPISVRQAAHFGRGNK